MIEVRTNIEIAASATTVWHVLTDLPRYAEWNPFIRGARGSLEIGGGVRLQVLPDLGLPLAFRARVIDRDEARELRWQGYFGARWLATGDHRFTIEPIGDHRVRFEQSETFAGLLPRLGAPLLARQARKGFEAMNRALAARAERAERAASPDAVASAAQEQRS